VWGDWGERADWQRCKGPNRQHLRRERGLVVRVCVVAVRVGCQQSIPSKPSTRLSSAVCLSVASFSLNNDISRFSRSSLTTASVSLTKLSRSFPPATLFDFLACLPAYLQSHPLRGTRQHGLATCTPPPPLPSTPTTARTTHCPRDPPSTTVHCQSVIAERKHHSSHSPTRTGARTTQR
jgi:hypothetical protein